MTEQIRKMFITPEEAENWLKLSHQNQRKLNPRRVELYASEMAQGRFQTTPDAIAFNKTGYLINGMHRLQAIVTSGVSISQFVASNLSDESFVYTDQGQSRSKKQLLKSYGLESIHADALFVIAKKRFGGNLSGGYTNKKITNTDFLNIAEEFKVAKSLIPSERLKFYNSTLRAVLILAISKGADPRIAEKTHRVLRSFQPESRDEKTVLAWIKMKNQDPPKSISTDELDWFAAQRLAKALERREVVTILTKNRTTFYNPKT